jgi:hypothetical protein
MKFLFLSLLSIFVTKASHAQELEGEWYGSFKYKYDAISIPPALINLKFVLNKDSTYTIYSYTAFDYYKKKKQYFDTSICLVHMERLTADSIILEEKKHLSPIADSPNCFQKMYLKISFDNDQSLLSGTWESPDPKCGGLGNISFIRRKRK